MPSILYDGDQAPKLAAPWGNCMRWRCLLAASGVLALSGCAGGHDVFLVGRTSGLTAQSKFRILNPGSDVSFTVGNEVYTGRWVYVEGAGSVGLGTATTFAGAHTVTTTGTMVGLPTGGDGTFIGSSPDGSTLRCSFNFSEMNLKGTGVCQDSKGETYDLQIE